MSKLSSAGFAFSELLIEVFRINGLALAAGDRLTAPLGLTSARWQVMGAIGDEPAPIAHIARSMGLTRQSVRETADALSRAGFLIYTDNPHHRTAKLVTLTPRGQQALRAVEQRHAQWASRLGRAFELAQLGTIIAELRRARGLLEAEASSRRTQEA